MVSLERVIPEMVERIQGMMMDAVRQNLDLTVTCGFRPLDDQWRLYNAHQKDPQHTALAAYPGTSNHGKVVNRVQIDATAVDLACVQPTSANISAHLKLATRWGLRRAVLGEYWHLELDPKRGAMPNQVPIQPKPLSQEIDDMIQYEWPDGAIVCVDTDGNAYCPEYAGRPTAKHFKGIPQLRDDAKIGFEKAVSIAGIKREDSQAGYVIKDQRWTKDGFRFEPGVEKFFK